MVANALIIGLITYTLSIVYNLIAQKSLETVFFIGVRFLITVSITVFFLQLAYYLIKNFNKDKKDSPEENNKEDNKEKENETEAQQEETENDESENSSDSGIENDFENQDFSAFNPEDFDLEQNSNQ